MARDRYGERLPVDPRIVERVQRSPTMLAEQGAGFMSDWGGPQQYINMASAPGSARVVYYAVLEGTTSPDQLAVVTGLSDKDVTSGLEWLQRKGYVKTETVS